VIINKTAGGASKGFDIIGLQARFPATGAVPEFQDVKHSHHDFSSLCSLEFHHTVKPAMNANQFAYFPNG
jgi:hypothetical protein